VSEIFSNVVPRKYIFIEIMTVYIVKVSQLTCMFATHKYNWIKKYQLFDMYVPDLYAFFLSHKLLCAFCLVLAPFKNAFTDMYCMYILFVKSHIGKGKYMYDFLCIAENI